MSTTIDQRVAELRFDNAHFERNVAQSLSTLDKLKQRLNLTGASKGLEDVGAAAKKVDLAPLATSADTVCVKFSHMQATIQHQLDRIVTKAVDTGARVVKALTIEPVTTGFQEYETQINAVQTILANTQSKGTTIDDVNKALDTLNAYADKTIYNFTEMTRNIGTFTAAGVDLDTSVNAIQGIANLAAVSGSTSQQASTAMYQLSQALSSGTVKLMDWNSVVNAGMGGQVFQDALKETARVHGIAIDQMIEEQGSFRETLSKGWLTSEILTDTLQKFTLTTEGLTDEQIKANREMLKAKGYTEAQIDEIFRLGATATDAATKVKTFTQLWDVLKEAAQSGWTQTWEIIVGDFEEAKSLLTPLSDFFTAIINKTSEWRNAILESALGKTFVNIGDQLKKVLDPLSSATDTVANMVESLKSYDVIVDEILSGSWGNGQSRWNKLAEAGYDWAHAQNLVNEKLGDSTRHATDYTDAQASLANAQENSVEAATELSEANIKTIESLIGLSDAELRAKNYTDDQIAALRELESLSNKLGIPIRELIKNMDDLSGRWILINSFKNIGNALIKVFNTMKEAWQDIFPPKTAEEYGQMLFNLIAAFHKFTASLIMTDETSEKLKRTFRGIVAAFDLLLTVVGGPIKIALKILGQLLGAFDLNILDITAAIGDAIYKFNEWVQSSFDFTEVFKKLVPYVEKGVKVAKEWFISLKDSEIVKTAVKYLEEFVDKVKEVFRTLSNAGLIKTISTYLTPFINHIREAFSALRAGDFDVAKDIIAGLVQGLHEGATRVWNAALEMAKSLLQSVCTYLGIHSPSTKFIEVGKNIIDGLVNGLREGFSKVWDTITSVGRKCIEAINSIDFGKVFAIVTSVALIGIVKKIGDAIELLSGPIEGLTNILDNAAEVLDAFKGTLKAFSANIKAKALKNLAIALAILAASVIALSFIEPAKLWHSVAIVAALAGVLVALSWAADKISKSSIVIGKSGVEKSGFNAGLLSIAASLLLLAITVKKIADLDPDKAKQGFIGLAGLVVAIGVVFAAYGTFVKGKAAQNIDKATGMLSKISGALLLTAIVAKLINTMTWPEIGKAGAFIAGFVAVVALIATIGMIPSKNLNKVSDMMIKLAGALLLMVIVSKLISNMEWSDMKKAGVGILGLVAVIAALTLITRLAGGKLLGDIGDTLIKISGAMLILVFVTKLIANMSWGDMGKAFVGLLGLSGVIAILVMIVKSVEKDAPKIAGTLLALSVAIGILAVVAILMGLIDPKSMLKGLFAVTILGSVLAIMIAATRRARNVKGSIMAMSVAIAVMAASAIILTLIDAKKLAASSAALSAMMLSFAQIAKQSSGLKGSMGSLIVMTVAIGLMAGAVYLLAQLPVESVLGSASALAILMLSLAVAFEAINKPSIINNKTLGMVGILTLAMAALAGILYLLKDLPVESTITNAISLSILLLALSGCCVILSTVGATGAGAFIGIGALMTLIVALGALIMGIGALVDKFPKLEEFLDRGIPILEKIGYGLGSFFGNIVGGFMGGVTSGLPEMATNLSNFMTNLEPFISGARSIDEASLSGVSSLVKMIALISGAKIIDAITSFVTGSSSMDNFAEQISKFGDAIVAFSKKVKGNIDESSVMAAANAGKLLAEMQSAVQGKGGVIQWFCGEKDLADFASQLVAFGAAIVGFSKTVAGNIDEGAVTAAANAGTLMTELQSKVAPSGGVVQWFCGEHDMATFGSQLIAFGEAIVGFSDKVKGGIDEEAITAAATAGTIMTELQSKILPTGGVIQWFCGEQNLQTFGSQLLSFGEAIVGFSEKVAGNIDENAVTAAINAGSMMVALQKAIPEDKWFDGKVPLDKFGSTITKFGEHMAEYGEKVTGLDYVSITSSAGAVNDITGIVKTLGSVNPDNVENFKVKSIGKALKSYSDDVSGLKYESITLSISAISKLTDVINNMAGIDASGVDSFKNAVSSLSTINIETISSSFDNASSKLTSIGSNIVDSIVKGMQAKQSSINSVASNMMSLVYKQIVSKTSSFSEAGATLINKLASGISKSGNKAANAVKTPISSAVTAIRGYYTSFYSSGTYLVDGFAAGITARTWKAAATSAAMADAAEAAAREALDINSPSKVFRALGYSIPEGLAMGIDKLSYMATDSASGMANSAISGVKNAISRISSYMDSDMDTQPTIRPVVDLSDVKSGANAINGLLSSTQSVGIMANVNSVSSMMSGRNQNGNSDIVSEIGKLRSALSNIGAGNTYNINGITYDDGSAVSDAISTLVRHTIIGGRA